MEEEGAPELKWDIDLPVAVVCGLVGQDAARILGQASLSPMLEGEDLIPVRDVGFSPLICDTD